MAKISSRDNVEFAEFGVVEQPFGRIKVPFEWEKDTKSEGDNPEACCISLNGIWDLVMDDGRAEDKMLSEPSAWDGAIAANVPCSVHDALLQAEKISDPMILKNNLDVEWVAETKWWMRKSFAVSEDFRRMGLRLKFQGVDYEATFWLNGRKLGSHEGMYGGPEYEIAALLNYGGADNVLIIAIEPAPKPETRDGVPMAFKNFKINVAYGWGYIKLITLGIWQPVSISGWKNAVFATPPFLSTPQISKNGEAQLLLSADVINHRNKPLGATLELRLEPKNFIGEAFQASLSVDLKPGLNELCFQSTLSNVELWWPHTLGDPNLYTFYATIRTDSDICDTYRSNFGFRTVEAIPTSIGAKPYLYNWQFVINGKKMWIKGTNWCYPDPLLRLNRQRYERFVRLAKAAYIELFRVWGGGPIETDDFYDLCDEHGILVWQEFPAMGYHLADEIPCETGEEIVRRIVPRLRNRPSLAVWCGGNELLYPSFVNGDGKILNYLGKRCMELDGTRPYRKTCPYGGDTHWYGVYWGDQPILDYKNAIDDIEITVPPGREGHSGGPLAFTEWGLASPDHVLSLKRFMPQEELEEWPLPRDGVFVHHTPSYEPVHIDKMLQYGGQFKEINNLQDLIASMQFSQGQGYKYVIEGMRAKKPYTGATFYYKLTENSPGTSWATIDYYGVPKRSHYDVKHAYAPAHVLVLFDRWNVGEEGLRLQVVAINDTLHDIHGTIRVRIYNSELICILEENYITTVNTDFNFFPSPVCVELEMMEDKIFFVLVEWESNGQLIDRNWYPFHFDGRAEQLWGRHSASLHVEWPEQVGESILLLKNVSQVPAIGVFLDCCEAGDTYFAEDNHIWIGPGETIHIPIRRTLPAEGMPQRLHYVDISGLNLPAFRIQL